MRYLVTTNKKGDYEMLRYINYWGIDITGKEEMQFDKWKSDRNNCPALNTVSHEKRIEYLIKFLNSVRKDKL